MGDGAADTTSAAGHQSNFALEAERSGHAGISVAAGSAAL
jgi:hypothetical protein